MKKILCSILALALVSCTFCGCEKNTEDVQSSDINIVADKDVTPNDSSEFVFGEKDGGIIIKGYKGNSVTVNIPPEINGKPVTAIGEYAFDGFEENDGSVQNGKSYKDNNINTITSIHIPGSVKTIEKGAFTNCFSLTELTFAEGVETLEEGAFACCDKVTSVSLPSSVTKIGSYAFYECYSIRELSIGKSVQSIGEYAFYNCRDLRTVVLPDSVAELGTGTFAMCSTLCELTLSKSLTVIPDYCFSDTLIKKADLPKGITELGAYAFARSSALTEASFPDSLVKIGERAFFMCPEYTEASVPASVTEIGEKAFGYNVDASKAVSDPEEFLKEDFIIKAKKDSAAEKYAKENGIKTK